MSTSTFAIIIMLLDSFGGAIGQYFFKKGANKIEFKWRKIINKEIVIAVFLYLVASLVYLIILPYGELSVLYPLVATNFIWVVIIARWKLNEEINKWKIMGLIFIIVGVILIGVTSST